MAAGIWIGSAFAQKAYVAYHLSSEVRALQRENDRIADANRAYSQQLQALARPGGAEEEARLHGYVRPDEKVFVIPASPVPSPAASPSSARAGTAAHGPRREGFWAGLWQALTSPFGRH